MDERSFEKRNNWELYASQGIYRTNQKGSYVRSANSKKGGENTSSSHDYLMDLGK